MTKDLATRARTRSGGLPPVTVRVRVHQHLIDNGEVVKGRNDLVRGRKHKDVLKLVGDVKVKARRKL